jgi:hypothetical protein
MTDQWRFRSRAGDYERITSLGLYPELDCSSYVGDADEESGQGQLDFYVRYLKRNLSRLGGTLTRSESTGPCAARHIRIRPSPLGRRPQSPLVSASP